LRGILSLFLGPGNAAVKGVVGAMGGLGGFFMPFVFVNMRAMTVSYQNQG
jgi:nitrate/nitrite transporter NarK